MKPVLSSLWRLALSCFFLFALFSPAENVSGQQSATSSSPTALHNPQAKIQKQLSKINNPLSGTPLATDPLGDMTEPNVDLNRLWVSEDANNYYISFDAFASNWGVAYGIYLDTDQVYGSGATTDPWGRNVRAVADNLPEHTIYVWHYDYDALQDAHLNHWNGSAWSYDSLISQGGAQSYDPVNDLIQYTVPKSAIGNPQSFALEVFTTGGDGHAQDTVPSDPNVAYTVPDWGSDITTLSAFAHYPPPTVDLDVTFPPEGYYTTSADLTVTGVVSPTIGAVVVVSVNNGSPLLPTVNPDGSFSQPVTLARGANLITVMAGWGGGSATVNRTVYYGGAHDDDVFWDQLGHDSRDTLYRTPGGPVTTDTAVTLRLRAASGDLTAARVRLWNDRLNTQTFLEMTAVLDDGGYEYWEAELPASSDPTIYWYRFLAIDGSRTVYYEDDSLRTGGWGQAFDESPDYSWQLTVYDPDFTTPDWVKNAVVYQIFPDRFRDGDPTNDTPAGSFFYDEDPTIYRSNDSEWNTVICDPRESGTNCTGSWSKNFYGGDLQGLIDKLDYLQDLGITAIYLNPIFEAPSNHKYDTTDYSQIDDNFGDLAIFQQLVAAADSRGIHLVLDGVFNHTSSDSIYFDRYGRYETLGACESPASPYRDWYYFTDTYPGTGACAGSDGTPLAADYRSWWGYDSLPILDSTNQEVRDLIWAQGLDPIGSYWIEQGADGWRLDVAGDVDPGTTGNPANDYLEGFRDAVKAANSEAFIAGEEWGNPTPWTLGGEWDASMNYPAGAAILGFWAEAPFTDNDHNSGSSLGVLQPLMPSQFDERIRNLEERYAPQALYAMLNLLDSHDTNRALFMLDENTSLNDDDLYRDPNYDWSKAIMRLKGVAIMQMTLPGAPTIYYGDEIGLVGPPTFDGSVWQDDPYNRQPFPWLDESGTPFYTHLQTQAVQDDLRDHYQLLIAARNAHPALRTGSFDTLLIDDPNMLYAYGRRLSDDNGNVTDAALVMFNNQPEPQVVVVDVAGYLPIGATFVNILDNAPNNVDENGEVVALVPGTSGAVFVLTSGPFTLPQPPANLAVTEGEGQVTIDWDAAVEAVSSYNIYRSMFSGGGYEFLTNTAGTIYTDTEVTNSQSYYYILTSIADDGLESAPTAEIAALPHYEIDSARLHYPLEVTHTLGITPTEYIYGHVFISDVTPAEGPTEGLLAKIGFAPTDTMPISWTGWVDADFSGAHGPDDEFRAQLTPEQSGEFFYLVRFSTTNGRDWVYADFTGMIDPNNAPFFPGQLHVLPSADLTAPAPPTGLNVLGTTASSITLGWDANGEPDLAGYDIFRQLSTDFGESAATFTRIARLGSTATTYTDADVTTNQTYDYYLSAFDENFNFSAASQIISGTAEARLVEVTFTVGVPDYTQGTVYIVGDIPELAGWSPGNLPMAEISEDVWSITIAIADGTAIQYKYTRGNWETVEAWGSIVGFANRHASVDYGETGTQTIDNTATDWGNGADDEKAVRDWRDPIVISFTPLALATDVPIDATIAVTWSHTMTVSSGNYQVSGPSGAVAGTYTYDPATFTLTFIPTLPLSPAATITVLITGLTDAAGNGQQIPVQWTFVTEGEIVYLHLLRR